jgi:hypothetical protein
LESEGVEVEKAAEHCCGGAMTTVKENKTMSVGVDVYRLASGSGNTMITALNLAEIHIESL